MKKQVVLPIALALVLLAAPAWPSSWQEADSGAVAILPSPDNAAGLAGATLSCEEQRWSFVLHPDPAYQLSNAAMTGELTAGRARFQVDGIEKDGHIFVPLGANMLEPIRRSLRMSIEIGDGDNRLKAEFGLKASSAVIDAVAERCSPINMSAYRQIVPDEADAGIAVAQELLANEVQLFQQATGRDPEFAARMLDLADGRALLVASLCGSTAYYGNSGCSLFAFARSSPDDSWNPVYHTEGMQLYLDEQSGESGFPDLLALPMNGSTSASRWLWNGEAYEMGDATMAKDQ